ncbi:hypothetical protein [Pseudomonas sp. Marseille-QA0892]
MADLTMQVTAAVLRRGEGLERLSRPLTLLALVAAMLSAIFEQGMAVIAACLGVVLFGLFAHYWAARVALDAELFERLAEHTERTLPACLAEGLDQALITVGLARSTAPRDWPERCRAALGLLRKQALCAAAQWLLAFFIPATFFLHA